MYKPKKTMKSFNVNMSEFKGLSKLPVIETGEVKTSENVIFDQYPIMSIRKGRTMVFDAEYLPQGCIMVDGIFMCVSQNKLWRDESSCGLSLSEGKKSMVEFWGKVYIFPDAKYYDMNTKEHGDIGKGVYPTNGSVPDMDYVLIHNNRMWGCKNNHIYASSLGNAMGANASNQYGWTYFIDSDGNPAETGSFAIDCSIEGDLKGIYSWDNRIVLLGEKTHLELYGEYPSNYSLRSITKYGTINCRSIQEVNSKLYYASDIGILQYAGGVESDISRKLNETYTDAVAGTDGIRYYVCIYDGAKHRLYVYHSVFGCWTEEESLHVVQFLQNKGKVYALCHDGKCILLNDAASTERIKWEFSFDDYSTSIYSNTIVKSLKLKVKAIGNACLSVYVSVDGEEWKLKREITFPNKSIQNLDIGISRGSEHRFKVKGEGNVEIYGFQYSFVDSGDK